MTTPRKKTKTPDSKPLSVSSADEPEPPASPDYIVLDTNMFMRLLIIEYATGAKFFEGAADLNVRVVLAPLQEDEIWRNLPGVFDEHRKAWGDRLREARGADAINTALKGLDALGVDVSEASTAAKALQDSASKLKLPDHTWTAFGSHAEKVLSAVSEVPSVKSKKTQDVAAILTSAAERRARLRNPPFSSKKDHHLVDCILWETVLHLLVRGHYVWFATTDGDFLHGSDLHPFLVREAARAKGKLEFFSEKPTRGHNPGIRFDVLAKLLSHKEKVTEFLAAADLLSPDDFDREPRDESECYCGSPSLIESMQCMKCGQDDYSLCGDENYSIEKARNGYRVFSESTGYGGEPTTTRAKCDHCGHGVFGIYFEGMCGYHQHLASKDD